MKLQVKLLISLAVCAVPIWASSSSSSNNSKLETKAKKEREGSRSSSPSSFTSVAAATAAVVSTNAKPTFHERFMDKTGQDETFLNAFDSGAIAELEATLNAGVNVNFADTVKDDGNAYTALSHIRIWSPQDAQDRIELLLRFKPDPFIRKPDGTIVDFAFTQLCGTRAKKALAILEAYTFKFCKDNKFEDKCKKWIERNCKKHPSKK